MKPCDASAYAQLEKMLRHSPAVIYLLKVARESIVPVPVMVSANVEEILGFTAEEALNPEWWLGKLHPEDRDRVLSSLLDVLTNGTSRTEYRLGHKEGGYRWVDDNRKLLRDDLGKPMEISGVWMDITERKRLESRLFESQKMETVGKLAGGVAHEFNSIMTAIIGQSELLLKGIPPGNPLLKNVTGIRNAADRAADLTRQLLAYGRKQTLRTEILDLNSLLTGMESSLRHLMGECVDVRIIPAAGLKTVKADMGQFEEVILNLATNAADAMPDGGTLTVETANVTLDEISVETYPELKPGIYVMLAVTDSGKGMSAEVNARVFEPFFSTKAVGQGTGLGLSTCHGIVKQSGGHISVHSEPGRGTTVKIYLPQVEAETNTPPASAALRSRNLPSGTETILMVGDDSSLREMSATLLRRLGYTVLTAADGIEALGLSETSSSVPVDLLFTDLEMPQMSGKELAERMLAIYPRAKVLFASAETESNISHQVVLAQGLAILQKPFKPSALANKLREVLG